MACVRSDPSLAMLVSTHPTRLVTVSKAFLLIFSGNQPLKMLKAVRFYRGISRELRVDFVKCCHCDHELSMDVIKVWAAIESAFGHAEIVIPPDCKDPHEFVNSLIAKKAKAYLEINSEMEKKYGPEVYSI